MAKNEQLEAKILQTAEELFLEKGFDATSTTDIARKVGCNQALVHYYYRTKENLFFQIFSKKFNLLMSYINAGPQGADSLEQVIQRFIDFYFNILSSNRNLPFFMINELIMNPERRRYLYDFMNQHADSNSYYQRKTYNMNAQPYYVIIDADGKILTKENYKYDRDVQKFVNWLNEGVEGYKARR